MPKKATGNKRQVRKPNSRVTEEMLPRYRNLTFTEAVEAAVSDRSGEILTSDIVAWVLYGEVGGEGFDTSEDESWQDAVERR